jgi:hypothetical protein
MSRTASPIQLAPSEQELLQQLLRKRSLPEFHKQRIQIVLAASIGKQNKAIAQEYSLEENRVGIWRKRWATAHEQWQQSDATLRPAMSEKLVLQWLADKKRSGRREDFTLDQRSKIAALSQELPESNGFPVTHWSAERLAKAAVNREIVAAISERTVHRILKKTTCRLTEAATGSMPR